MSKEDIPLFRDKRWLDAPVSRRTFLKLTSTLALGAMCPEVFAQSNGTVMQESRAILDEGLAWVVKNSTEKGTDQLCERIKQAGFNVFVPNVWHGRGTTWPTSLAPWDDRFPQPQGFDPLNHLIETARKYELEIHPWFNVGLRQRDFYPQFAATGTSEWFDFHNPAFRDFIVALLLDVVKRYPVQGINLDSIRFDSPRPGFEAEQESVVVDVVRRVSIGAKAINPNIVVSVDATPWLPTIAQYGENSPKWADEGLVDVIYSEQYQPSPDFEIIRQIKSKMKRPEAMVVMVGNFDRIRTKVVPRDPKRVCELIEETRELSTPHGNGVALYYYGMFNNEQINLLRETTFKSPARPKWERVLPAPTSLKIVRQASKLNKGFLSLA